MIPRFPEEKLIVTWDEFTPYENNPDVQAMAEEIFAYSWRRYVNRVNDLAVSITIGNEDRVSMQYKHELLSEFLNRIGERMDTIKRRSLSPECESSFVFDSLADIGVLSLSSMNAIFNKPSSKLIRVSKLLPVTKAKRFDGRTAMWLSQRPGNTVQEKVSPTNKILTTETLFTKNTTENQETMYLYENLCESLGNKVKNAKCADCDKECFMKEYYMRFSAIFNMRKTVREVRMDGVEKKRHTIPNNRMISDMNYKTVYKSVKALDSSDNKMKESWNGADLKFVSVVKYMIAATLLKKRDFKVVDSCGYVNINPDSICFSNGANNDKITLFQLGVNSTKVEIVQKGLTIEVSYDENLKKKVLLLDYSSLFEESKSDMESTSNWTALAKSGFVKKPIIDNCLGYKEVCNGVNSEE